MDYQTVYESFSNDSNNNNNNNNGINYADFGIDHDNIHYPNLGINYIEMDNQNNNNIILNNIEANNSNIEFNNNKDNKSYLIPKNTWSNDEDEKDDTPISFADIYLYKTNDDKRFLAIGIIFGIIEQILNPALSLPTILFIESTFINDPDSRSKAIWVSILVFGAVVFFHFLFYLISKNRWLEFAKRQTLVFRFHLIAGMFNLENKWKLTAKSFIRDSNLLQRVWADRLRIIINWSTIFIICLVISLFFDCETTIATLFVSPVLLLLFPLLKFRGYLRKNLEKKMESARKFAFERISSIKCIASFSNENYESKQYSKYLSKNNGYAIFSNVPTAIIEGLEISILSFSLFFSFSFVSYALDINSAVPIFLMLYVAPPISEIALQFSKLKEERVELKKIFKKIYSKSDHSYRNMDGLHINIGGDIEFKDVSLGPKYPESRINLTLGDLSALTGDKSKKSIVELIMRKHDPQCGEILIGGVNIKDINIQRLRGQIGLFSRDQSVMFNMSIAENIMLGKFDSTMEQVIEAAKQSLIHGFISSLPNGYETIIGENGFKLTENEELQVLVARLILKKPNILLVDNVSDLLQAKDSNLSIAIDNLMAISKKIIIFSDCLTPVLKYVKTTKIHHIKNGNIIESVHPEYIPTGGPCSYHLQEEKEYSEVMQLLQREIPKQEILKPQANNSLAKKTFYIRIALKGYIFLMIFGFIFYLIASCVIPVLGYLSGTIVSKFLMYKLANSSFVLDKFLVLILAASIILPIIVLLESFLINVLDIYLLNHVRTVCFNNILHQDLIWHSRAENSTPVLTEVLGHNPNLFRRFIYKYRKLQIIAIATIFTFENPLMGISITILVLSSLAYCYYLFWRRKCRQAALNLSNNDTRKILLCKIEEAVSKMNAIISSHFEHNIYRYLFKPGYNDFVSQKAAHGFWSLFFICFSAAIIACCFKFPANESGNYVDYYWIVTKAFPLLFSMRLLNRKTFFEEDTAESESQIERLAELYLMEPKTIKNGAKPDYLKGQIDFYNINYLHPLYPNDCSMENFYLTIPSHSRVALVGPLPDNWATESVFNLLMQLNEPGNGDILLDGNPIRNLDTGWIRSNIGLIESNPVLFSGATVLESIKYGNPDATMLEVEAAIKTINAESFISKLPNGYDTLVDNEYQPLTSGQKILIGIARAILKNPRILLFDDLTKSIEEELAKYVKDALDGAMNGRTAMFTSTNLSMIYEADIVALVRHGRILEVGNHELLYLKNGAYASYIKRIQQGF